jgi:hypothetical protein
MEIYSKDVLANFAAICYARQFTMPCDDPAVDTERSDELAKLFLMGISGFGSMEESKLWEIANNIYTTAPGEGAEEGMKSLLDEMQADWQKFVESQPIETLDAADKKEVE